MITWRWRPGLIVAHAFDSAAQPRRAEPLCNRSYAPGGWVAAAPTDRRCKACTRRLPKPLTWTEGYPDCGTCLEWLSRPGMAEAIASVGIEKPRGISARWLVLEYHANRHREA